MFRPSLFILMLALLNGCTAIVGHEAYVNYKNSRIGTKALYIEPYKFKHAGEFSRGNFGIVGQGVTHVTINENGDLVVHWFSDEILPHFRRKQWVGKCLTYYVVDPKTHIIKDWGFDEGGNPLSCRTWP